MRIPTFKKQRAKDKKRTTKLGIILKDKEAWLYKLCKSWLDYIGDREQVFILREARARQLLRKYIFRKVNPYPSLHQKKNLLRHSRLTHLAEFGVEGYILQMIADHESFDTTKVYIQSSPYLIERELMRKLPGGEKSEP
jgi:site-specific recombinase XerD